MNHGMKSATRLPCVLAAALLAAACSDAAGPQHGPGEGAGLLPATSSSTDTVRIFGTGTIGSLPKIPGNDVRDFDLDVASTLSGRVFYRDWMVVRPDGSVGTLKVSPTDTTTRITAFRDSSTACADPSTGVEFDGVGRVNTGGDSDPSGDELLTFTVWACDAGPAGGGADYLAMIVPAHDYARGDQLTSGDLVKSTSGAGSGGSTGDLVVTTSTSGSDLDPDGYTVTVDGVTTQAIAINGSVTFSGLSATSHTVALSGVSANCSVSGSDNQTVTVPSGGAATAAFAVTCVTPDQPPVVDAGPDETALLGLLYTLAASFTDPDHDGPWSYTIDWGDGSSSSGTTSSQGTISATHSYLLPLSTRTVTVTVTDSHGASGSDTKQVTVIL